MYCIEERSNTCMGALSTGLTLLLAILALNTSLVGVRVRRDVPHPAGVWIATVNKMAAR